MINPKSQIESRAQRVKDEFWEIVKDCLVEFHDLPLPKARDSSCDLRARIEFAPRGISTAIFYHSEPFDVACDIAGKQLDFMAFRDRYECLLKRHGWQAEA